MTVLYALEFVKSPLVPPVDPFPGFFGKGDVVEGECHVERVEGRGEFAGQAGLAELFCVLALVGAVDPAKILFPKGVPGAFDVGGGADAGSTLADPKIGCDDVPAKGETRCCFRILFLNLIRF